MSDNPSIQISELPRPFVAASVLAARTSRKPAALIDTLSRPQQNSVSTWMQAGSIASGVVRGLHVDPGATSQADFSRTFQGAITAPNEKADTRSVTERPLVETSRITVSRHDVIALCVSAASSADW
jgi:hypothetical protein